LLIMARPELLEARPGWGGGKLNATTVLLEPLSDTDARDLLRHLLGPARLSDHSMARVLEIAEGNPLFVEELVAMLVDSGVLSLGEDDGSSPADPIVIAVPLTIQALIAARLDRLASAERNVIEAASIEGKEFAGKRVEALVGDGGSKPVDVHLRALVRKDLIRPVGASDDTFRFRHQLIRDGVYDGMPKELRAELHERFAEQLDAGSSAVPVADEMLGYHLERAVRFRRELGASDDATSVLAARASGRLRAAGRRAVLRDDPASVRLLERALALIPRADRAPVLVDLANALDEVGDLERCAATAAEALELARTDGDRRTAARARVVQLRMAAVRSTGEADVVSLNAAARPVLDELEALGDDEGMASMLVHLGHVNQDCFERSSGYLEQAPLAAERAGDQRRAGWAAGLLGGITVSGPVPAAEGVERCRALRRRFGDRPGTSAALLRHEAVLHAMQGHIDEARALHAAADDIVDDLGSAWLVASSVFGRWRLELLAGAPERAETSARASLELFQEMGATSQGSTAAALLASVLAERGQYEDAIRYADLAAAWAAPDDIASQVPQLAARARTLAARGELERAEATAREAVQLSKRSDDISQQGDALIHLAAVRERAGRAAEAATALRDAIVLYERKGDVVSATRTRTRLEGLGREAAVTET
jgi:tetratricopeptide (TPR) repeat protein